MYKNSACWGKTRPAAYILRDSPDLTPWEDRSLLCRYYWTPFEDTLISKLPPQNKGPGSDRKGAIRILAEALSENNDRIYEDVIFRLREFGSEAKAAIPALTRVAKEAPMLVTRRYAVHALREIEAAK